jgi:hypothetical protein
VCLCEEEEGERDSGWRREKERWESGERVWVYHKTRRRLRARMRTRTLGLVLIGEERERGGGRGGECS